MAFAEIVDIEKLRELCESYTMVTGAVTALLELDGTVLIATGWQDICTRFHRVNEATACRCRESDTILAGKLAGGAPYNSYKCKNGLIDVAVPITIRGEHVANFFTGQFFTEAPDRDYFVRQAEEFGFDKDSYLEALQRVPIFSEETIKAMMLFFSRLARLIGEMGISRKELEESNLSLTGLKDELQAQNEELAAIEEELRSQNDGLMATEEMLRIQICEHEISQKMLHDSEERFRLIMESVAVIPWEFNIPENRWTYVGPQVTALVGYTPEEWTTLEWWLGIIHPEDQTWVLAYCADLTSRGEEHSMEYRLMAKDGTVVWVNDLVTIEMLDGKPRIMRGVLVDITDRKRAELENAAMYDRFVSVMNSLDALVYVADMDTYELLFINEYGKQLFGNIEGQMCWKALQGGQSEPCSFCTNHRLVENGKPARVYVWEFQNTVTGNWYQCRDKAILWNDNHLVRMEIATDITARKQAEETLNKSENRFRTLVNTIPDLIWLKDTDGVYLSCNSMFERFFGAKEADIVGRTDYDFVEKELADFFRENDHKAMAAGKPISNEEWITFSDDGKRALLYTTKTPMYDNEGKLVGVLGVGHDIGEIKRNADERARLEDQLQQSQKMESVGRLAGGVAHDFNNLLTVILGGAYLALNKLESGQPLHEYVTQIQKAGKKSAELTQQLLAFARKQTIEPKVVDLNEIVSGMIKMLQRLIGENTQLTWQPANNLWSVKADPSQIDQILANLCVNARDSIADIGTITIQTGNSVVDEGYNAEHADVIQGEYVHISVCDNGCGMDKETMAHIFEPFYTTKGVGKGTGLGLATVYGAAKQNNGFVNVYSEPGIGTTFTIYLPRYVGNTDQKSAKEQSQPAPRGLETILLVEDEPAILNMTMMLLQNQGYTVMAAETPGEAIRLANEHFGKFDLIITDVIMPEMNGRDLANNLMLLNPKLKCLFMSGYTADVIAHHGVLEEGMHFIHKPFALPDLAVKVRKVLDYN